MRSETKKLVDIAAGLGAGPFPNANWRSIAYSAPSVSSEPLPARALPPYSLATPSQETVGGTLLSGWRQMQKEASLSQTAVGSDYWWATLNVAAIIGGHTFPAGTRIAVAPSQTAMSGGGKAHTQSIVTKVWAKFGQTFDSSSWVEGWITANLFTYTGQAATWSGQTGFGDLGRNPQPAVYAATSSVAYSPPQQSFPVDYGSSPFVPPNPWGGAQNGWGPLTANQMFTALQRLQASNAMDAGGHLYGRPIPPPPSYPRSPMGTKKHGLYGGVAAPPHGGGGHGGGGHGGGGHGSGFHGGGFRRGGFRRFGEFRRGFAPFWDWRPEVFVVEPRRCQWIGPIPSANLPPSVFAALQTELRQTLRDGSIWQQTYLAPSGGSGWYGKRTFLNGGVEFYVCAFITTNASPGSGLYGLGAIPEVDENNTIPSGDYHIGATNVNLRSRPDAASNVIAMMQNGEGVYAFGDVELDAAHAEALDGSVIPNPDPNTYDGIYYAHIGTQTHGAGWVAVDLLQTGAGNQVQPQPQPQPAPAPAPISSDSMSLTSKVLLGGAIGTAIAAGGLLVWNSVKKSGGRRRSTYA